MIQFFRKIIKACSNQTKISEIKRNVQNGLFFVVGKALERLNRKEEAIDCYNKVDELEVSNGKLIENRQKGVGSIGNNSSVSIISIWR